ncbi:hypothetical protein Cgig2_014981 [Carnegiea gigantea]|uniref:Uncharacterized protein n=1 Tax=Carnegiea gigantea TaxID=171969 RepID=A0A9Q1JWX8_9CARY|nr:hypothetical protein Cgig2_014981 [Carnegiea gigantea]
MQGAMDIEGQGNEIPANENLNSISKIIALDALIEDDKKRSSCKKKRKNLLDQMWIGQVLKVLDFFLDVNGGQALPSGVSCRAPSLSSASSFLKTPTVAASLGAPDGVSSEFRVAYEVCKASDNISGKFWSPTPTPAWLCSSHTATVLIFSFVTDEYQRLRLNASQSRDQVNNDELFFKLLEVLARKVWSMDLGTIRKNTMRWWDHLLNPYPPYPHLTLPLGVAN